MESGTVPFTEILECTDFELLANGQLPQRIAELQLQAREGKIFVFRRVYENSLMERLKQYLSHVGRSSLPNYVPIEAGCPNSHRINNWDERAYVKGCFHQFQFFPWNQDVFQLFQLFRPIFALKNILNNLRPDKFLSHTPEEDCVARLAFQFYPCGGGGLKRHIDPLDKHQLIIPSLVMSKKGKDFQSGGVFVERADGSQIFLDDLCDPGDVVFFNPQIIHGVQMIDPDTKQDWLAFQGRWMGLFAINKFASNTHIPNSKDLGDRP